MDSDLDALTREQLAAEVRRLRAGIREHRDSSGHGLCWHHPGLWGLLPERSDPVPVVPEWPQFLQGCIRYRQSLDEQLPQAPRSTAPHDADDIALDHLIVPARDRRAAAERLASILDVPWGDSRFGPFTAVYVSDGLTLDFDEAEGEFAVLHYCFRVDEERFDGILARLQSLSVPYRSTPHGPVDRQVNTQHGGRIVYWSEPDGHAWEVLTQSYARRPATAENGG